MPAHVRRVDALAGVETARVVLAKVRQRLERESGQRGV
jgi:hypothetical protein